VGTWHSVGCENGAHLAPTEYPHGTDMEVIMHTQNLGDTLLVLTVICLSPGLYGLVKVALVWCHRRWRRGGWGLVA